MWIIINSALILIAQSWLVIIFGVGSMFSIYMQARQDDLVLVQKFGDNYNQYMEFVPRLNLLLGVFRLIRHNNKRKIYEQ